jgi:serine/threonine protein kinase
MLIHDQFSLSAAFIRVFEDIHRAGVRHHDPRLENLMVNDDGGVTVIDFDKAELDASQSSRAREMVYVKHVLDGVYPNRDSMFTERTPPPIPVHTGFSRRHRRHSEGASGSDSGSESGSESGIDSGSESE